MICHPNAYSPVRLVRGTRTSAGRKLGAVYCVLRPSIHALQLQSRRRIRDRLDDAYAGSDTIHTLLYTLLLVIP